MNHMTTAQAELLLRLAELLDEMEEENIEISVFDNDYPLLVLDGVSVLQFTGGCFNSEDIRSITIQTNGYVL